MKEYILYIVIGLAIAGVIAVYFLTKKNFEVLDAKLLNLNNGLLKLSKIINSNSKLSTDDPFDNSINNLGGSLAMGANMSAVGMNHGGINMDGSVNYEGDPVNNDGVNSLQAGPNTGIMSNDSNTGIYSNTSSSGHLQSEIENLKIDIGNIEDLIDDSSGESNQYDDDLDPIEYNQQLSGINQEEELYEGIEIDNQGTVDINYKNNSSEFDDLGDTEIEKNSELNTILNKNIKTVGKIEGAIKSLEENLLTNNKSILYADYLEKNNELEKKTKENADGMDEGLELDNEEASEEGQELDNEEASEEEQELDNEEVSEEIINVKSNISEKLVQRVTLTDIEAQVISDKYTKRQLEKICLDQNLSKSGNKVHLVYRLNKSGHSFKSNTSSISNKLSVN